MIEPDLRDRILAEPERLLEDRDVMNALVSANERERGANIVDLRGIAMQRLESRLDRLEDTHRSVIAAAYENLAGTNQVHRAVLQLLEPTNFESFIKALTGEVAQTLRVDTVRLVLETLQDDPDADPTLRRLGEVLQVAPAGFVGTYLTNGRNGPGRQIVLRSVTALAVNLYGNRAEDLQSEALMKLDLGPNRLPGMLVFASEDPTQFKSTHGTDLLQFFAGVFERSMRRWLG
ncbi:MAG: DUF484 family protein [Tabrizicola sp.]|uniref:DUF484 family protein n=1 Tax=Tabrizicola sp. TaxID=2005166 RepID=UPI002AB996C8|nr:DUF484 family protein [Tabrizicola sp.]MDZ4088867.1 DUF484 family protein [Tabrizicola sp.]